MYRPTVIRMRLRLNELLHLKLVDIDSKNKIILIRNAKGGKDRVVMLSPPVIGIFKALLQDISS